MTATSWDRHRGHAAAYDVVAPGYNFRMDEIHAAVGREQLKKLAGANARRGGVSARMRAGLEALGVKGLRVPFGRPRGEPAYHLFPVLLPEGADRRAFREALTARGIQTSIHYPPLGSFSVARELWGEGAGAELPVLERIAGRLVTLPIGPGLSEEQVDWVVTAAGEALRG